MSNRRWLSIFSLLSSNLILAAIAVAEDDAGNNKVPVFVPVPSPQLGSEGAPDNCCLIIHGAKCEANGACAVRRRKECGRNCPLKDAVVVVGELLGIDPHYLIPAGWQAKDSLDETVKINIGTTPWQPQPPVWPPTRPQQPPVWSPSCVTDYRPYQQNDWFYPGSSLPRPPGYRLSNPGGYVQDPHYYVFPLEEKKSRPVPYSFGENAKKVPKKTETSWFG